MVWLILLAIVILVLLTVLKIVSLLLTLVGILLVISFAAWRLDRARGAGAAPPYRDAHRPDFYGRASESHWEPPTAYIDHPRGAGTPPGVDDD